MRKLQNYQSFNENRKNDLVLEELMVAEAGTKPKFDCKSFKNFLTEKVNESVSYLPEEIINEMHSLYELSVLANSRPNWDNDEDMMYIESGEHIVLCKNNELFVIESKTFNLVNKINESSEEGGEKKPFWKRALNFIDTVGETAVDVAPKIWSAMSNGAKKAWKFFKSCLSLKDSHGKLDWGKICGLAAAAIGLLGGGLAVVSGGLSVAIAGPLQGALMVTGGVIHIQHGFHHMKDARERLKATGVRPMDALIAGLGENLGEIMSGFLGILVGSFDIFQGATVAITNPAAGSVAAYVKETAKEASHKGVLSFVHGAEGFFEHIGQHVFHLSEGAALDSARGALTIATVIVQRLIQQVVPWLWKKFLEVGNKLGEYMSKVTNSAQDFIDGMQKIIDWLKSPKTLLIPAIGPIAFIVGQGLNAVMPTLKDYVPKFVESLKPVVERFSQFMKEALEANKKLEEIRELEKKTGHHTVKGITPVGEPSQEQLQETSALTAAGKEFGPKEGEVTDKDKELLKKAIDQQKEGGEGEAGELNFKDSSKKLLKSMLGVGTREEVIYDVFKKIKSDDQLKQLISNFEEFAKSKDGLEMGAKINDKNLAKLLSSELDEPYDNDEVKELNKIMKANGLKYRLSKDKKEFIIPEEK